MNGAVQCIYMLVCTVCVVCKLLGFPLQTLLWRQSNI